MRFSIVPFTPVGVSAAMKYFAEPVDARSKLQMRMGGFSVNRYVSSGGSYVTEFILSEAGKKKLSQHLVEFENNLRRLLNSRMSVYGAEATDYELEVEK